MKRWCVVIFYGILFNTVCGQEKEDLYYAQPPNTGLYLGFLYVNEENFVLAGLNTLYLFNHQKLLADTLPLSINRVISYADNVMHLNLVDAHTLSVATLNRTLLINIKNNKFFIQEDYATKTLARQLGKYDLFILFKAGLLARTTKGKSFGYQYFTRLGNGGFSKLGEPIWAKGPAFVTFLGSEIIGFTKYQVLGNDVFLFDRRRNKLTVLNTLNGSYTEIPLPELNPEDEAHEFFIDKQTKRLYLVKLTRDEGSRVFEMSKEAHTITEKALIKYKVRGVYNGKCYVSGFFDGAAAHYLIPLYGKNNDLRFIDNE